MNDKSQNIIDFIDRRFKDTDANWLHGNCYWFAQILKDRFDYLDIYYEPVLGHFLAGYDNNYFDYTGQVYPETVYSLNWLKENEVHWYERILKDCIY